MNKQKAIVAGIIVLLLITGCTSSPKQGEAGKVVETYFNAWNSQDYATMYGSISDGFKQLEPTAKTLTDFGTYASAQQISEVKIVSVKETSNDGKVATVDYNVEFTAQGKKVPFAGTYTVKWKPNDNHPEWKLIHPYGKNIDAS